MHDISRSGCAPGAVIGGLIEGAIYVGSAAYAAYKLHQVLNEAKQQPKPQTDEGKKAPPGNGGTTDYKHGSDKHDELVNEEIQKMRDKGSGDVWKNQSQVDANGNKVRDNKPDAQGTNPDTKQREYVEVDRNAGRSIDHYQEIMKNDPSGKCPVLLLGERQRVEPSSGREPVAKLKRIRISIT